MLLELKRYYYYAFITITNTIFVLDIQLIY